MTFCLPKKDADRFKDGLKSGKINPAKLNSMTSAERREFLKQFVGDAAAPKVNAMFEQKLLLKNQKAGMVRWAQSLIGTPKVVRRDLISRIQKMDRILDADTEETFLADLASQKVGKEITFDEAKVLTEHSKKVKEAAAKDMTVEENRIEYGLRMLEMEAAVNEMVPKSTSLATNIANLPRTLNSTLDLSAPLRQGWGMVGRKEWWNNIGEMMKVAVSEDKYQRLMADIITRPTYDLMRTSGLRITKLTDKLSQREEAFMSSLLDRVPVVRGSERAYTGFLNKLRADVFDTLINKAELKGEDVSKGSKAVMDIAEVVNNFTGSGDIGKRDRFAGAVPLLNTLIFSPRKTWATINIFRPDLYAKLSPTARNAALRNIVSAIAFTGVLAGLFVLNGWEVDTDPKNSDFGKVKKDNVRIDLSGGNANFITLLSRIATGRTKSSLTGIETELGSGYGETSRWDLTSKWIRNKLSPIASYIVTALHGEGPVGQRFDPIGTTAELVTPISMESVVELYGNAKFGTATMATMMEILGAGASVYDMSSRWYPDESKQLQNFYDEVGEKAFMEANDEYNDRFEDEFGSLSETDEYQAMTDEEKKKELSKLRKKLKSEVIDEFSG